MFIAEHFNKALRRIYRFKPHKVRQIPAQYTRGRKGFDGDFEVFGASRGGSHVKIPNLKLNANNNLAYAA